jgi:hypothetical protein
VNWNELFDLRVQGSSELRLGSRQMSSRQLLYVLEKFSLEVPGPRMGKVLSHGVWVAGQLAWPPGRPKAGS